MYVAFAQWLFAPVENCLAKFPLTEVNQLKHHIFKTSQQKTIFM